MKQPIILSTADAETSDILNIYLLFSIGVRVVFLFENPWDSSLTESTRTFLTVVDTKLKSWVRIPLTFILGWFLDFSASLLVCLLRFSQIKNQTTFSITQWGLPNKNLIENNLLECCKYRKSLLSGKSISNKSMTTVLNLDFVTVPTDCHDSYWRWLPFLFGWRSAVVVTGLLAATDLFSTFSVY